MYTSPKEPLLNVKANHTLFLAYGQSRKQVYHYVGLDQKDARSTYCSSRSSQIWKVKEAVLSETDLGTHSQMWAGKGPSGKKSVNMRSNSNKMWSPVWRPIHNQNPFCLSCLGLLLCLLAVHGAGDYTVVPMLSKSAADSFSPQSNETGASVCWAFAQ